MATALGARLLAAARSFNPASMPLMGRRSYRWEITSACFLPLAVACVEANVISVIARKAFNAGDLAIAMLAAAPAMSNISSLFWTRFIRGRDRVRAVNAMQLGVILCVVAIALAPISPVGQFVLVMSTLVARTILTGIITARSDIWRANYPRTDRARVTGKITIVAAVAVGTMAVTIGAVLDAAEAAGGPERVGQAFRILYFCGAAVALVGVWAFSNVRWRGRASAVRAERAPTGEFSRGGAIDMLRILKSDITYRRFMTAQFMLGLPNLAAIPIFIIALEDTFSPGYLESLLLAQVFSLILPIITIPLWARLLDRTHIVRFRVFHSWFFVAANILMGVGFLTLNMPLLYLSRIVLGIANGGGMLAWNLGHHDFAKRDLATLYMGIHVTLTGVRGAIAPFIGALLYSGALAIPAITLGDLDFPGASIHVPRFGHWTFIILAAWSVVGALLFLRLHLDMRKQISGAPKDA